MSNDEHPSVPEPPVSKGRGRLGLTGWIFVGLVAGVLVGVLFKLWIPNGFLRDTVFVDGVFYIAGQGFIRLMKMLVAPLVFFSLVCGAAAMEDVAALGKTGGKILGFYLGTTACAICVALSIGFLIRPGVGLDLSQIASAEVAAPQEKVSAAETVLNIIPENPFGAIAGGAMLQVIFFALLVGVLIAKMGPRADAVARVARQCNDLMMEMTALVMKFAPIGVFCILARTFANLGFDAFAPLLKYMAGVVLSLGAQCFIVYSLLLFLFTRLNPIRFFRKFLPVMAFAFSTATSNATIPMNIKLLEERLGVPRKLTSFTIPLGATLNMDGTSIMQGVAVVFAAQAYGIHLGLSGCLTVVATATLASVGTAGIPAVGLVTLSTVFLSVGLPVEAIGLIIGVDRILDMLRTAVNITGDAICTTVVASQNGDLDRARFLADVRDIE